MTVLHADNVPLELLGVGKAVTEAGALESETLDGALDLPVGSVFAGTGVRTRYISPPGELPRELMRRAFRHALLKAKLEADSVDVVLLAKYPGVTVKSASVTELARELSLREGVPVLEIGASGANAVSIIMVAAGLLNTFGTGIRKVAVLAGESVSPEFSKGNWAQASTFGEGAAALILGRGVESQPGLRLAALTTALSAKGLCRLTEEGKAGNRVGSAETTFQPEMTQPEPSIQNRFSLAHTFHPDFSDNVRSRLDELRPGGLQGLLVVPHQGSRAALDWVHQTFEGRGATVVDILEEFGNQGTASALFALAHACDEGLFQGHDEVLMLSQSAGLTGGVCLLHLPHSQTL